MEPLCKVKIPQAFYREGQFVTLSLSEIEFLKARALKIWSIKEERKRAKTPLVFQGTNIFLTGR